MKKLLLVLLLLFPIVYSNVYAGASPEMFFQETLAWQHILEDDDMLIVVRYQLTADGTTVSTCGVSTDWDDCSASDAFADLYNEAGTLIQRNTLPFLGPGLVGFYLTPTEVTAALIDFSNGAQDEPTVEVYSSPILFVPNTTIVKIPTIQPNLGATQEASREDLGSTLVSLIKNEIQDKNIDTDLTNPYTFVASELVEDDRITLEGRRFVTSWLPNLVIVLSERFQLAGTFFIERLDINYASALSADEAIGQTILSVDTVVPFSIDNVVKIRDTVSGEIAIITAVGASTITIDTDPDTGGNQGLVNAYTTAAFANVSITAFTEAITNSSRDSFEVFANSFGIPSWALSTILLVFATGAGMAASGNFVGNWTSGLGIFPIIFIILLSVGIIQIGFTFILCAVFIAGGGIMYARGATG